MSVESFKLAAQLTNEEAIPGIGHNSGINADRQEQQFPRRLTVAEVKEWERQQGIQAGASFGWAFG